MAKKLSEVADKIVETDVLVVGCGGAAARAAIEACKNNVKVTMIIKGPMGKSGATPSDGGAHSSLCSKNALEVGLPGEWDPTDSVEELMRDFLRFGAYINNQKMVEVFCETGAQRVKDLLDFGAKGSFMTGYHYYPTHPRAFSIMAKHLMAVLIGVIRKSPIQVIEDFIATDLLSKDGKVVGAVGLNLRTGEFTVIKAKAVVLGTGGFTAAYEHTTTNDELTGDGHAIAYRAGAELSDMEMTHFLPLTLTWPKYATRSTFGCGWWMWHGPFHLYNVRGERFMKDWTPKDMEATDRREVICSAIMRELVENRGSRHGGVYWSVKHLPTNLINDIAYYAKIGHELCKKALLPFTIDWFYLVDLKPVMKKVLEKGEAIEMSPAAHSTLGGIRTNEKTETNIPGLYAAGECTGGPLGAKRPGGSECTLIQVFGPIAGKMAAEYAMKTDKPEVDVKQVEELRNKMSKPLELKEGIKVWELLKKLRRIAYYDVGSYRDGPRLERAIKELEKMRREDLPKLCIYSKDKIYNLEWLRALELENMLVCIEAAAMAALTRTESRGVHYRADYPNIDFDNWTKNIVVKQVAGEMKLRVEPIVKTIVEPPKGIIPWAEYTEMEPYVETTLKKMKEAKTA